MAGTVAVLPDMDLVVGFALGRGREFHGLFSHTLVAVALVAVLAWLLAGRRWALIAAGAYGSHLLLDILQERRSSSVQPLWPVSSEPMGGIVDLFPSASLPLHLGPVGVMEAVLQPPLRTEILIQTAIAAAFFLGAVGVRRWWWDRRPSENSPPSSPAAPDGPGPRPGP